MLVNLEASGKAHCRLIATAKCKLVYSRSIAQKWLTFKRSSNKKNAPIWGVSRLVKQSNGLGLDLIHDVAVAIDGTTILRMATHGQDYCRVFDLLM